MVNRGPNYPKKHHICPKPPQKTRLTRSSVLSCLVRLVLPSPMHVLSCPVLSCLALPCPVLPCLVVSCLVCVSCLLDFSCLVLPLSCLMHIFVLSSACFCLVWSVFALSYFVLSFLVCSTPLPPSFSYPHLNVMS
jgi:hypothetical protein